MSTPPSDRQPALVLGSGSPRRRDLLAGLGLQFDIAAADIDETPLPFETPSEAVVRLAAAKATAVLAEVDPVDAVVLAADTLVGLDGEALGKPDDAAHAARMLRRLAGRTHTVWSGVAVARPDAEVATCVVQTLVEMRPMSDEDIDWYVATGEPLDKAGAYAIQTIGGAFVVRIDGSYSNVVGLPLVESLALLSAAGVDLPAPPAAPLAS